MQLYDQFNRPISSAQPKPERSTIYTRTAKDNWSVYPSRGITPLKLARILKNADLGYPAEQVWLFRDVEEKDAHVASQLHNRKQAVQRLQYEIFTDSDDPRAEDVADFCRQQLSGIEDLDDLLLELLDAVSQGWAMSELKWDISEGQAVIAGFQDIPQERTLWDEQGIPRLATDAEPVKGIDIPAFKVVYHQNRTRKARPARAGIMRTNVWWWLFKNFSIKDWAAFCEVYGMPIRLGKYEAGASKDDRKALMDALKMLGSDAAAIVSKAADIEFIETKARSAGKTVFESMADYCDRAISKATLGQTLTSDVGKMGSYSAAKVHEEVRSDIRDADAQALAKTIRQQMLRPLALFNFGPDAPVPWFIYNIDEPEDLKEKAEVYKGLQEMGLGIATNHVYEVFSVPRPEAGEDLLGGGEVEAEANRAGAARELNAGRGKRHKPAQKAVFNLEDKALALAAGPLTRMGRVLIAHLERAEDWDQALDYGLHAFAEMGHADLAEVLMEAVLAAELNGRLSALPRARGPKVSNRTARANTRRVGGPRGRFVRQSNSPRGVKYLMEPVKPTEAFRFFSERAPMSEAVFKQLSDRAKARAFTVAGVMQEDLLAELHGSVDRALREGTTFAEFKAAAGQMFAKRGLDGPTPWHLQTVFRNNIQSSYMAGRYRQMSDPDVLGARPFWQYETVGDQDVRPDHAAQHGKVYPAGHPFWSDWWPPNGHACRCDVLSLSSAELRSRGLVAQKSMPPERPDKGWDHNVGEAGWGRGLVESSYGIELKQGPWRFRPDLLKGGDPAPALPLGRALPLGLPANSWKLLERMDKTERVKDFYRQHAVEANGFGRDAAGKLKDLALVDKRGDRVILAARTVDHVLDLEADLERARYLGLARSVVEDADEVWLVPGIFNDGRVTMRRYYFKFYEDDGPDSVMVIAEFSRGVWVNWNVLPLRAREAQKRRVGLMLHPLK